MAKKKLTEEEKIKIEQQEANNLVESGMHFMVRKKSALSIFSKNKERKFIIRQPYLGALDLMCKEFLKLEFDEEEAKLDSLNLMKKIASRNMDVLCNIVAISVLDSEWKIKLFKKYLAYYIRWRVTPETLLNLSIIILQLCNHEDFMHSIRFLRVVQTTRPQLIENDKAALNPPME